MSSQYLNLEDEIETRSENKETFLFIEAPDSKSIRDFITQCQNQDIQTIWNNSTKNTRITSFVHGEQKKSLENTDTTILWDYVIQTIPYYSKVPVYAAIESIEMRIGNTVIQRKLQCQECGKIHFKYPDDCKKEQLHQ